MKWFRRTAIAGLLISQVTVGSHPVLANSAGDGMPGQAGLDVVAPSNMPSGLWGDAPGGVAGRPYVKTLNLVNGSVTTPVITNGSATTAESSVPGSITATIAPYNMCKTGQTPAAGQCYATPNRLTIQLGYVKQQGSLGFNFSAPTAPNGSALPLVATVNADTVFEVVVNMNTWGTSLRWTWMNAAPQYWKVDNLGTASAEITMRFKLVTGPDVHCMTAVPVMPCNPTDAARNMPGGVFNPQKILRFDSVLSLDDTGVSTALSGALFASSNADIGSLETFDAQTGPQLTYGITGPSEMGGTTNSATFYAFVSDTSLLNYFGVTSDVVGTEDFKNSALAITRADGGSGAQPSWTRTTGESFGTSGWFLTVSDINFNGTVSSQGVGSAALVKSNPAKLNVRQKVGASVSARRAGALAKLTFKATASACAKASCRIVVQKISGKFTATSSKVTTAAVVRKSKSVSMTVSAKVSASQSLTVLLQSKKSGKWVYVSSRVVKP